MNKIKPIAETHGVESSVALAALSALNAPTQDKYPIAPTLNIMQTAVSVWKSIRFTPEYWPLCVMSLLSALLSGPFILSIYTGYAFGLMNGTVSVNSGWLISQSFWLVSCVALMLLVLGACSDYALNNLAVAANASAWRRNIVRLFGAALNTQFNSNNQASLHSIKGFLADSVEVFQRHQLYVLQHGMRSVLVVMLTLVYLLAYDAWFIVVVFFALGLTFLTPIWLAKMAQPAIDAEPFALSDFNRYVLSILRLGDLFFHSDTRRVFQQVQNNFQRYIAVEGKKWIIWNFAFNFKVTLNLITSIGLLTIGGVLYFYDAISVSELIAVYLLVSMTVPKLDSIYKIYNYLQSLKSYYQQFAHLHNLARNDIATSVVWEKVTTVELDCRILQLPRHDRPLFESFSIQLESGKTYLLCGKSGTGKTTLLNMLLGLQKPDRGSISVNGYRLEAGQLPAYWQRVALHEQNNLLIADLTAIENIRLVPRPIDDERYIRASQVLGLNNWGDKNVSQLSGGEIQRLCFLRAYIYVADIFIFDEPTSALDSANEILIKELLSEINNAIVVIVSHRMDFGNIADHIWSSNNEGQWSLFKGGNH